jgi:hypothetical protein
LIEKEFIYPRKYVMSMKNARDSYPKELIDEHTHCPKCQYEFTARFPLSSKTQNLVQTSCPRCKFSFELNIIDINKKRTTISQGKENNLKKSYERHLEIKKLYNWPQQLNHIDVDMLLISFFGRSNVSSPLLISDHNGKPNLLQDEKILNQAGKITATIFYFKKPMRRTINVGEGIFCNFGPGTIYRTDLRLIYTRPVRLNYHLGAWSALGTLLHWKNNGYHESFSVPISKITDIKTSHRKRRIHIYLEDILEERIYEITLYPHKFLRPLIDDLLER